jgi:hypothetical protein
VGQATRDAIKTRKAQNKKISNNKQEATSVSIMPASHSLPFVGIRPVEHKQAPVATFLPMGERMIHRPTSKRMVMQDLDLEPTPISESQETKRRRSIGASVKSLFDANNEFDWSSFLSQTDVGSTSRICKEDVGGHSKKTKLKTFASRSA